MKLGLAKQLWVCKRPWSLTYHMILGSNWVLQRATVYISSGM